MLYEMLVRVAAFEGATAAEIMAATLYLLGLDRRTLDVLDVDTGRKLRTITFGIPPEDQIEGFSTKSDGTRVLLTTGGDRNTAPSLRSGRRIGLLPENEIAEARDTAGHICSVIAAARTASAVADAVGYSANMS